MVFQSHIDHSGRTGTGPFGVLCHVLLLLALVTSGISPACAFIAGKMQQIEICAADGTLKTVTLSRAPSSDQSGLPAVPQPHKSKKTDCMFCFSASAFHPVAGDSVFFQPFLTDGLGIGAGTLIQRSVFRSPFEATGPPNRVL